jgi:dATP/dGTP diphosphohydrolase
MSSTLVVPPTSKALGSNPKDILGVKKVDTTKIPAVALAWEALAMMDGAGKYDPYNWRANKVVATIYIAACKRHLDSWLEGQEEATDSGCHHLGHARACLGILLDAQTTGNLIDDRPVVNDSSSLYEKAIAYIASKIPAMQERHRKFRAEQAAKKAAAETQTIPYPLTGGTTSVKF